MKKPQPKVKPPEVDQDLPGFIECGPFILKHRASNGSSIVVQRFDDQDRDINLPMSATAILNEELETYSPKQRTLPDIALTLVTLRVPEFLAEEKKLV